MSAEIVYLPFPPASAAARAMGGPPPVERPALAEHNVIREGDAVYDGASHRRLGRVLAIVGDDLIYAGRWGRPTRFPLVQAVPISLLPWESRP